MGPLGGLFRIPDGLLVFRVERYAVARAPVSLRNSVEHAPDGEWGCSIDFGSYPAMPNSSAMKVAWAIASSLATHLALPFRIIFTASIPCNVRQAVKNELENRHLPRISRTGN